MKVGAFFSPLRVLSISAFVATPHSVWSHAGLVKSEPGRRAVLSAPPEKVRLCFNEKVEAKFSSVRMMDKDGVAVSLGEHAIDLSDPNCLIVPITGELASGSYTLKYKVLSVDGHIVDYGFEFTLKNK